MRLLTRGCLVTLTLRLLALARAATAQPAGQVPHSGLRSTGSPPPWTSALSETCRHGCHARGPARGTHGPSRARRPRVRVGCPWQGWRLAARRRASHAGARHGGPDAPRLGGAQRATRARRSWGPWALGSGLLGHTMKVAGVSWAVVGVLVVGVALGWLQPIAPDVLAPHLHPRDPARPVVTFVALGDMGNGSSAQRHVAHALWRVCHQEGCDFVLGLGDNLYPHGVASVHDPAFQEHFEQPYARFHGLDFWMILGNHDWRHLLTGAQAQIAHTLHSDRWRLPYVHYAIPFLPAWLHIYGVDTSLLEA